MKSEEQLIKQIERMKISAPEGFADRVMRALPTRRERRVCRFWPERQAWVAPAFAGAMAALLVVFGVGHLSALAPEAADSQMTVHFELHAPGAARVELLGNFNDWVSGDIVLVGPDASGHWTADVELPAGRYEYIFLVDGEQWLADPAVPTHRSDGFGRMNTVIKVYENDSNT